MGQTDRQTGRRTPDRYIDLAPHIMRAVPIRPLSKFAVSLRNGGSFVFVKTDGIEPV